MYPAFRYSESRGFAAGFAFDLAADVVRKINDVQLGNQVAKKLGLWSKLDIAKSSKTAHSAATGFFLELTLLLCQESKLLSFQEPQNSLKMK